MTASEAHTTFTPPDPEFLAQLLPGYQIIRLIACGGMGAVYEAVQLSLDRGVAIKILPQEFTADESFRAAFETEAKAMARMNHPNLISVYDFGEVGGMLFITMEYVPGLSLFEAANGQPILQGETVPLIASICRGLAHAHENGIIHRDIKPANILLNHHNEPKIGDFGLARPLERQIEEGEEIFGTPGYTAPEVVERPQSIDHRADIYSIGILLHELLTGMLPTADPRPASAICRCDPRFDTIIRKATHPVASERFNSATEIANEVEKIQTSAGPRVLQTTASAARPARPIPSKYPIRKKSGSSGLLFFALMTAIVIGVYFLIPKGGSENEESVTVPSTESPANVPAPPPATEPTAPSTPPPIPDGDVPPPPPPPPAIEGVQFWGNAEATMEPSPTGMRFEIRSGDIGGMADSGIFKSQTWSGDGVFIVALGFLNGEPGAKSGIMIREGLEVGARHAFLARTTVRETLLHVRNRKDHETQEFSRIPGIHTHLRIKRIGDRISADASVNGRDWQEIGVIEIKDLSSQIHIGFAASSHDATSTLTVNTQPMAASTFDPDLTVEDGPAPRTNMNELFRRARSVMRERATPIQTEYHRANEANITSYLQESARFYSGYAEIQRDVETTGHIPYSLPHKFSNLPGFHDVHATHLNRQKEISDAFITQMAELEQTYLSGINSQIERTRSENDTGAIQVLQLEKQRLTDFPSYFRILMDQDW